MTSVVYKHSLHAVTKKLKRRMTSELAVIYVNCKKNLKNNMILCNNR